MFGNLLAMALSPIVDTLDVIDGLTEGEIRTKAASRLGSDVVAVMAISELIDYLSDSE